MKLEIKRSTLVIIPEDDLDKAFIENTLKLKSNGNKLSIERVDNVVLGFIRTDEFALVVKNE